MSKGTPGLEKKAPDLVSVFLRSEGRKKNHSCSPEVCVGVSPGGCPSTVLAVSKWKGAPGVCPSICPLVWTLIYPHHRRLPHGAPKCAGGLRGGGSACAPTGEGSTRDAGPSTARQGTGQGELLQRVPGCGTELSQSGGRPQPVCVCPRFHCEGTC